VPFVIGVLGDDPFGPELDAIQEKTINGRQITIKRFQTIDDILLCHLLFFSFGEKEMVKKALQKINNKNILTVGEAEGFAQTGGMIGFVQEQNKIRFEINRAAAANAGLTISSKLLKLAIIVEAEEGNLLP
jgi:hypothetical protein